MVGVLCNPFFGPLLEICSSTVSDTEFRPAMNVSEEGSREVILPFSLNYQLLKDLKETKCWMRQVIAHSVENRGGEVVLDDNYYVRKPI